MNPVYQWTGYDIACDGTLDIECREVQPEPTAAHDKTTSAEAWFVVAFIIVAFVLLLVYPRRY